MARTLTGSPLGIPRRLVQASWAIVVVLTAGSVLGSATSPLLLVKAPLLLVALAPDGRHVALVAGTSDPLWLICLAVVRRTLFSVGVFGLGAAYGERAVHWIEARSRGLGKALRALERLFARVGAALLIVAPFLSLCILAGAARTRFLAFLPALVVGHSLWAGLTIWLGTRIAAHTQVVTEFFAERLVESTLVCVALVLAHQLFSFTRRKRKAPPSA